MRNGQKEVDQESDKETRGLDEDRRSERDDTLPTLPRIESVPHDGEAMPFNADIESPSSWVGEPEELWTTCNRTNSE
jgi:hypothetical protein